MRRILVIPLLFLLVLCVALLLFAGLDLLVFRAAQPDGTPKAAVLLHVPAGLLGALPAAVLVSLAAMSFRRPEGAGWRFLSFIILFVCALAALGPGYRGLLALLPAPSVSTPPAAVLRPGRINRLGEAWVYVDSLPGGQPAAVVLLSAEGGLRFRDHASLRIEGEEAVLYLPDGTRAARGPAVAGRAALFRFHPQVEAMLSDIRLLNVALREAEAQGTQHFLLLAGSLIFFLSAVLFLLDGRHWPLIKVLAAFLLVRGIFFLHALLKTGIADEARKLLPGSSWAPVLTPAFLLLAGALCLLVGLLLALSPQRRGASRG